MLSVNPLVDLEVNFPNPAGGFIHRYLGFSFRRIMEQGRVARIFVAVRDITAQIELERKLRDAEKVKERQLQILLGMIHVAPSELDRFTRLLETELEAITEALRAEDFTQNGQHDEGLRARLDAVFRSVHNIKGNAAFLRLDAFKDSAEDFEKRLVELRDKALLSGDDFLSVVVAQARLAGDLSDLTEMRSKLNSLQNPALSQRSTEMASGERLSSGLKSFVSDLSTRLGKTVDVELDTYALHVASHGREDLVLDVLIQLARNSLVHGIESPEDRLVAGKPPLAKISVRGLPRTSDGLIGFCVRDDGRGLDISAIRSKAEQLGLLQNTTQLSDSDAARLIFTPGFSTASKVDGDAGRGVGIDIIKSRVVDQAGGALELRSAFGKFCEFLIFLPSSPLPASS